MQPFDTPPPEPQYPPGPRYLTEPPYVPAAGAAPEPFVETFVGAPGSPRRTRRALIVLALLAAVGLGAATVALVARSSARSDADAAEARSSRLAADVSERDKTIDSLRVVVDGHHDEVARLEDQLDADESVIDEMQTRVDNVEEDLAETEASLLAAQDQLDRATEGRSDDPNTSASLPTANDGIISPMEAAILDTFIAGQDEGLELSIEEYNALAQSACSAAGPWDLQAAAQDFADKYDLALMSASIMLGSIASQACLDVILTMAGN